MNIKPRDSFVAWTAICISLLLQAGTFAEDSSIRDIQAAWTRRANYLRSFHVKCSSIRVEPPPSRELSEADIASGRTGPRAHELTSEVWFSKDEIAIEIHRDPKEVPWLPPVDRYVHHSGGSERIHSKNGSELIDASASGAITEKSGHPMYGLYMVFWPLFTTYSGGATSTFGFDFANARVLSGQHISNDVRCCVMRSEADGDVVVATEVCVDPSRDYLPVRMIRRINERQTSQIDCHYTKHQQDIWRLDSWKLTVVKSSGELSVSETVKVVEFEINPTIPESVFRIDFPEGAPVLLEEQQKMVQVAADGVIPGRKLVVDRETSIWKFVLGFMGIGFTFWWFLRGRRPQYVR